MKLFNWLFKNKNITSSVNLVCIQDIISMPDKKFYQNHSDDYKKYYNIYMSILPKSKSITSINLNIDDKDITFYSNIITNLSLKLDYIINPVNQSEDRTKEGLTLIASKFLYYKNEMTNYKDALFIRWKVLENILNRKVFLSYNKKCAINNEINNITGKIVALSSTIHAIDLEIINYYDMMSLYEIKGDEYYLRDKSFILKKYLDAFNIKNTNERNFNDSISSVLHQEILITEQILKESTLKDISKKINRDEINLDTIDEFITKAQAIKDLYNNEMGNNLISKLYSLKYDLIKKYYQDNVIVDKTFINDTDDELEYFANRLRFDFNNIIKDKDGSLSSVYTTNKREILILLKSMVTNDMQGLLYDKFTLSFLFNITSIDKLKYLFDNTYIKEDTFIMSNYGFDNHKISLSSFLRLMHNVTTIKEEYYTEYFKKSTGSFSLQSYQRQVNKILERNKYSKYLYFYQTYLKNNNIYKFYDGMKTLRNDEPHSFLEFCEYMNNYDDMIDKDRYVHNAYSMKWAKEIYFSDTLETASFGYYPLVVDRLHLNQGLKTIFFDANQVLNLYIPSSVEQIYCSYYLNARNYIFTDYENSKLIHSHYFFKFLRGLSQSRVKNNKLPSTLKFIDSNGNVHSFKFDLHYSPDIEDYYNNLMNELNVPVLKRGK